MEAEIKPHTIVIDCEGVNLMDSRGSAKIAEVAEAQGIDLRLPG